MSKNIKLFLTNVLTSPIASIIYIVKPSDKDISFKTITLILFCAIIDRAIKWGLNFSILSTTGLFSIIGLAIYTLIVSNCVYSYYNERKHPNKGNENSTITIALKQNPLYGFLIGSVYLLIAPIPFLFLILKAFKNKTSLQELATEAGLLYGVQNLFTHSLDVLFNFNFPLVPIDFIFYITPYFQYIMTGLCIFIAIIAGTYFWYQNSSSKHIANPEKEPEDMSMSSSVFSDIKEEPGYVNQENLKDANNASPNLSQHQSL